MPRRPPRLRAYAAAGFEGLQVGMLEAGWGVGRKQGVPRFGRDVGDGVEELNSVPGLHAGVGGVDRWGDEVRWAGAGRGGASFLGRSKIRFVRCNLQALSTAYPQVSTRRLWVTPIRGCTALAPKRYSFAP